MQPVIGLEIHVQAKTKSKMFCSCDANYFGDEPNTHVCPVCLGLPGALPVPNAEGINQALKMALALNCEINQFSKFDRKNYFYPDLPKGYQISQYDLPFGKNGFLEIGVEGDARRIRIRRVHLEEDTGKSMHEGDETLLDFNKSGMPLIEIVTEPDFTDVKEITAFAKLLKQTVQYIGVSEAEMQKGQMRFELNISVRTDQDTGKYPDYKVEVKNIGSISVLEKVVNFEIARQSALLEAGEKPVNETRGIRDMTGETYSQRIKETEGDYRYFPEPDIPPIEISNEQLQNIKAALPELPAARKHRYMEEFGMEDEQAEVLVEQREKSDWLDEFASALREPQGDTKALVKEAAKWLVGEVSGLLEKNKLSFTELPVAHDDMKFIVTMLKDNRISGTIAKKVFEQIFAGKGTAKEIVEGQSMEQVTDTGALTELAQQVIDANPDVIANLAKNPNAYKALVGAAMRESKGKANPQLIEQEIKKLLNL